MKYIELKYIQEQAKNSEEFIVQSENAYESQLKKVVKGIKKSGENILLLAGPSGSGKTTSAIRIAHLLKEMGIMTHTVSMDDYFLASDRIEKMPLNADGTHDLESPRRLDIELFREHLTSISNYEEISIPCFDFKIQKPTSYKPFKCHKDEIVIIEGIHALNPEVIGDIPSVKLYVSVRTRINDGNLQLHPKKIRLMRRLCRDYKYRGRSFNDSVEMFKSVSVGETNYIMPFKKFADYDIDSFIAYEACMYSRFIRKTLYENPDTAFQTRKTYLEILPFINAFPDIPEELIPSYSLVREFIGGSSLKY